MTDPRALLDAYARELRPILLLTGDALEKGQAAPKAFAALRAVLDLHKPYAYIESVVCKQCKDNEGDEQEADYPCPTVQAITKALDAAHPDSKEEQPDGR